MILTGMTLDQAISLEPVFAKMQPNGLWELPMWLVELERELATKELVMNVGQLGRVAMENYCASIDYTPSREG